MNREAERDAAALLDLAHACRLIIGFVGGRDRDGFFADPMAVDAVLYRLTVLGEAVKRLSVDFRARHPAIAWKGIAGMRDRVVHDYDRVDTERVWDAVAVDVPALLAKVELVLSNEGD